MKSEGNIWMHIPPNDCSWYWKKLNSLKNDMIDWYTNDSEVIAVLERTRRKHWKQFKKELVAAIWAAIVYYTWKARNWTTFKNMSVQTETVVLQIKKDIVERLDLLKMGRKGRSCTSLIHRLIWN
ncbi:hypothetical protein H5410_016604 [Solanum commersonii]|uniref:Uncharacterized protein n=1 Tax=Solanum commersonii TaxID=4109 RepID=A0A9J5ZXV2_SOLCO|nr:hypothetical protein H5410_016604 [Solanum commersonii]